MILFSAHPNLLRKAAPLRIFLEGCLCEGGGVEDAGPGSSRFNEAAGKIYIHIHGVFGFGGRGAEDPRRNGYGQKSASPGGGRFLTISTARLVSRKGKPKIRNAVDVDTIIA